MSDEHATHAMELLPNACLERLNTGHATHLEAPQEFIRVMLEFGEELNLSSVEGI